MPRTTFIWPIATAALGALAIGVWLQASAAPGIELRNPVKDVPLAPIPRALAKLTNPGTLIPGSGKPSSLKGSWPQFRGADRSNIAHDETRLARQWPKAGPKVLWRAKMGDGFAGAAIHNGRVYVVDHVAEDNEDAIRCLSLDNGEEIWRYTYHVDIRPFHGITRTVPAVNDRFVVALGPKCQVTCLDAVTGVRLWQMDLVKQFGTVVPEWYAGQCPLIDGDVAIIAPGANPIVMAVELAGGHIRWRTPNPGGWAMTHSSITPIVFRGEKQYLYCASEGVVAVAADDGELLWKLPGWKVNMANVPAPVFVPPNRIFLTGGYKTGSKMIHLSKANGKYQVEEVFRLTEARFGAEQHTPILYQGHLYGIASPKTRSELVCLSLGGRRVWSSGNKHEFGLGSFMMADGLLFLMQGKKATLHMVEATPNGFHELAQASLLSGKHAWAPMAMAAGRLIIRGFSEMVCLELPKEAAP